MVRGPQFLAVMATCCALAACSPTASQSIGPHVLGAQDFCGISAISYDRAEAVLGRSKREIRSGDAVRACDLPNAESIASACRLEDAVRIPTQDPYGDDDVEFADYSAQDANCGFTDSSRTHAQCSAKLVTAERTIILKDLVLKNRFLDLSDDVAHDYWSVSWAVAASCTTDDADDPDT